MPINRETVFVIPTHRLKEVGDTVRAYDEHFWRNGHAIKLIVFDDSSVANHNKYFSDLENTATYNPLFYVGPKEKEQFIEYLGARVGNRSIQGIIRGLFRPSYGGNRNCALMYTLGDHFISSDDDMRPHGCIEDRSDSLEEREVSKGKLLSKESKGYSERSYDLYRAFADVIGKKVSEVPTGFERGEYLEDSSMDLETNVSRGVAKENSLFLKNGKIPANHIVKMAQTYRSGTNDIDALDYAEMFLHDDQRHDLEHLNDIYVLSNFRPVVTKVNWRMDCGVAAYDNSTGLPPFFPTRLRFEDYVYRLWIQQDGIASAHVDAVQTHMKSNYMRNPLAAEVFNEEIANLLKRKIKSSLVSVDELTIGFDYDGQVSMEDASFVLDRVKRLHSHFMKSATSSDHPLRKETLTLFSTNLEKAFYGFEPDFFQQNVSRIVDDVITQFKASFEIWPTLVEIAFFQKMKAGLPMLKVKNPQRRVEMENV